VLYDLRDDLWIREVRGRASNIWKSMFNILTHSFLNTGLEKVEAKARIAVFCSRLIALNSMPTPTEVILETTE
jgi:hypothetical protein